MAFTNLSTYSQSLPPTILPCSLLLPFLDLPSLALRQHLRAAARSLSRRLMDTTDMRWHFKEWRQTTSPPSASSSSSSSCVDLVGETEEEEEEGGKEGELVLKAVTSAVTAAAIEEGVQVGTGLSFISL